MKRSLILVIAAAVLVVGAVLVFRPKPAGPLEVVPAEPAATPALIAKARETAAPQPSPATATPAASPAPAPSPSPTATPRPAQTPIPEGETAVEILVSKHPGGEPAEGVELASADGAFQGGPWFSDAGGKLMAVVSGAVPDLKTAQVTVKGAWMPYVEGAPALSPVSGDESATLQVTGSGDSRKASLTVVPVREILVMARNPEGLYREVASVAARVAGDEEVQPVIGATAPASPKACARFRVAATFAGELEFTVDHNIAEGAQARSKKVRVEPGDTPIEVEIDTL